MIHRQQTQTLPVRNFQPAVVAATITAANPITIEPPFGGGCRIYRVRGLNVQLGGMPRERALESAPQTPIDANIWSRVTLGSSVPKVVLRESLVLLNYNKGKGGTEEALAWAEQYGFLSSISTGSSLWRKSVPGCTINWEEIRPMSWRRWEFEVSSMASCGMRPREEG